METYKCSVYKDWSWIEPMVIQAESMGDAEHKFRMRCCISEDLKVKIDPVEPTTFSTYMAKYPSMTV